MIRNLLVSLFLLSSGVLFADSVDVYKVTFRGKTLGSFNQNQVINIFLKTDSVYSNDTLKVNVFRDTPCATCKEYTLIIFGSQGPMLVDSTQKSASFYIPLKPLVEYRRKTGSLQFNGYYTEYHQGGRSRVVAFRVVFE